MSVNPRLVQLGLALLLVATATLSACGTHAAVTSSDLAMSRVLIYRNGMGYFERKGVMRGDSMKLAVRNRHLNDVLKSLTVVDLTTQKPASISLPLASARGAGGEIVDLTVRIAGADGHEVLVTYIHEAPAWKAAYRLWVEGDSAKKALLQGWAMLDNVTGEDWKDVSIGLVAGSPLTFRYDLYSTRVISRSDLRDPGQDVAYAPPPSDRGRDPSSGATLADGRHPRTMAPPVAAESRSYADYKPGGKKFKADKAGRYHGGGAGLGSTAGTPRRAIDVARGDVAEKSRDAAKDESDDREESLRRARVEQQARRAGELTTEQIERSVRDMAETRVLGAVSRFDVGDHYTVPNESGALVNLMSKRIDAEEVFLFRPEQAMRGMAPYRALRVKNDSGAVLESGPITLYKDGTLLGEGFIDRTDPGMTVFVAFAKDPGLVMSLEQKDVEEAYRLVRVIGGEITVEVASTRRATYEIESRVDKDSTVYVRRARRNGFKVKALPPGTIEAHDAWFIPVKLKPRQKATVTVDEFAPVARRVAFDSKLGIDALQLWLADGKTEGVLKGPMQKIVDMNLKLHCIEQRKADLLARRDPIIDDDARTRENLDALPRTKMADPLRKRLLQHLADNEKRMSDITRQIIEADIERAELRDTMLTLLREVRLETAVAGADKKDPAR